MPKKKTSTADAVLGASSPTLLEGAFPYRDVSRLVAADRRAPDPAYQTHRWWARRPPALIRAALLSAALPGNTDPDNFWSLYRDPSPHLAGTVVLDPFLGGGTTLVEAARLGAGTVGRDVDPVAVLVSKHQLDPPSASEVRAKGEELVRHLSSTIGHLWPVTEATNGRSWRPLHYFSLALVDCPGCATTSPLYRSLVIARSVGKRGAVVRDAEVVAFCPDCMNLQEIDRDQTHVTCCGTTRALTESTYDRTRFTCPSCGDRSTHEQLGSGTAPRALIAVEETPDKAAGSGRGRRRIRGPLPGEAHLDDLAGTWMGARGLVTPAGRVLETAGTDNRPVSFGISTIGGLHTARQSAFLAEARDWVRRADLKIAVSRALLLTVSATVTSNNRLCGYATDYGRLAPLFSVRAFALPWLAVELNPLNPDGGRGTLRAAVSRTANSCEDALRRSSFDDNGRIISGQVTQLRRHPGQLPHQTCCSDSTAIMEPDEGTRLADICLTDPPFYDFIPYNTLSQVFRAWFRNPELAGSPLLPEAADPVISFGNRLGQSLAAARSRCNSDALIAFTYKGGAGSVAGGRRRPRRSEAPGDCNLARAD